MPDGALPQKDRCYLLNCYKCWIDRRLRVPVWDITGHGWVASFADLAIIAPGFLHTHANNSSTDENNAARQQSKIRDAR